MSKLIVPNMDGIFDPTYAKAEAEQHFGNELELGREVRAEAVALFKRAFLQVKDDHSALMGVAVLFRQALSALDGCILCLENGAVDAAHLHARSLWEADLYRHWLLSNDRRRWAAKLYVWGVRQERHWVRRAIPGTVEFTEYAAGYSALGEQWSPPPKVIKHAEERDKEIEDFLTNGAFKDVNEEFNEHLRKHKREPLWHQPGTDGVPSIKAIAKKLGRESEYDTFFTSFSYHAHGARTKNHITIHNGAVSIQPIRRLKEFPFVFNTVFSMSVRVIRRVMDEYRVTERDVFERSHVARWKGRLRVIEVEERVEYERMS